LNVSPEGARLQPVGQWPHTASQPPPCPIALGLSPACIRMPGWPKLLC